jgi:hypothetical protein
MSDIEVGDKVTHHSHVKDGLVGTVVEIEADKYSFDDPTYNVVWGPVVDNAPAIPYRRYHHLMKVHVFVQKEEGAPGDLDKCQQCGFRKNEPYPSLHAGEKA